MRDYTGVSYQSIEDPRTRKAIGAIDYFLKDLSRGLGRIQSGEVPDGSGSPILPPDGPFLYKPGIAGGQIAYGGVNAGDDLELHSGVPRDGSIFFGANSALDEANTRLGVGTSSPQAVLHLTQTGSQVFARPVAFTQLNSPTHWTGNDAGTTNLQNYVNEVTLDESTYVTESTSTSGTGPLSFTLWTNGNSPIAGSPTIVLYARVRRYTNSGVPAGTEQLKLELKRGGSSVKTVLTGFLGTSFVDSSSTLSGTEVTNLTGSGDVTLECSVIGIGSINTGYDIAQIYLVMSTGATTNLARWDTAGAQSGRITVDGYVESQRLQLLGTTSGTFTQRAAATTTDYAVIWPSAQGGANTTPLNDGSGNLSWGVAASNTFLDSVFRVQDNGDTTKQLAFECSGISTATTRTLTVPDRSSTIVTLAGTQTFTGPIITLPSAGTNLQCDDALTGSGNAGVFGTIFDITSGLSLTLEMTGAAIGSLGSLVFPSEGGTVVVTLGAQTLSSKTLATSTIAKTQSASTGFSFSDTTTSTNRLRFVLQNGVGANSITLVTTAARDYQFTNVSGRVVTDNNVTVDGAGDIVTSGGSIVIAA